MIYKIIRFSFIGDVKKLVRRIRRFFGSESTFFNEFWKEGLKFFLLPFSDLDQGDHICF